MTDKKYKLAFVVSMFFQYGGMQRSLLRIARACQARGHEVELFTGELRSAAPEDLTLHLLNSRAWSNAGSNARLAQSFQQATAGQGFDCCVGFTKLPGLDVYYAGDPCYAARVDEDRGSLYKLLPRYHALRRQERQVFTPMADTEILLFAHPERDKFIRYYGTQAERFHMLPPGINRERLLATPHDAADRTALRAELGMNDRQHMVLMVAAFFKTKGVDRAIHALAALPEALRVETRLVIVGDDRAAPYQRLAADLGVAGQVIFTGAREDVARFYFAADLLLHPAYTENTGTAILEAMVCGLPVLATGNCGFAGHITAAGAGEVCAMPFQQAQLNRQLQAMLSSGRREEWRRNARHYTETTDLYGLIESAADVIEVRAARNRAAG